MYSGIMIFYWLCLVRLCRYIAGFSIKFCVTIRLCKQVMLLLCALLAILNFVRVDFKVTIEWEMWKSRN